MNMPDDLKELLKLSWDGLNDRFKRIIEVGMGAVVSESVALYFLVDELGKGLESKEIRGAVWATEADEGYDIKLTIQGTTIIMEGKHVNEKVMRSTVATNSLLKGLLKDLVKLCVSDNKGPKLLLVTAINSKPQDQVSWPRWEKQVDCRMGKSEKGEIWRALVSGGGMDFDQLERYWQGIPKSKPEEKIYSTLWKRFASMSPEGVQVDLVFEEQGPYARLVVMQVQPIQK